VSSVKTLRVGLTGGIGSGKSTVAAVLAGLGAAIVDTDLIARELSAPGGGAIANLASAFGSEVIDANGALNRERMRAIVFADEGARLRLEAILHPMISAESERRALQTIASAIVFDVPLLVESERWPGLVDLVWVVDCEEGTQVKRVMGRSRWDRTTVARVMQQQATRTVRRARADTVIYNDGISVDALNQRVADLWARYVPAEQM